MAELQHILGSLFSDVAQSVFTSDLYSRDISRYYEQDALLRHFPVPRTEIAELEVELKFAIAGVEVNPAQTVGREAGSASLFIDLSYDLSESFYEQLHDVLVELKAKNALITNEMIYKAGSPEEAIYLRQDLLKYFIRSQGSLVEEGNFQVRKAMEGIREILEKKLYWILPRDFTKKERTDVYERVTKQLKLESDLKRLEEPLSYAWNRAGDFKLDVEITADKLIELSSEHLSSVHVRTRVRNYKWSDVEHEGRKWRALNPE
jgi:hypothetical protein